ncbi:hypothetical protein CVO76_08280, partial [Arthrobacter agilis]
VERGGGRVRPRVGGTGRSKRRRGRRARGRRWAGGRRGRRRRATGARWSASSGRSAPGVGSAHSGEDCDQQVEQHPPGRIGS